MKYIIGNWKANKQFDEARAWIEQFGKFDFSKLTEDSQIIICPPYPFIAYYSEKIASLAHVSIGSQDLSRFDEGAYTGEITARSLSGIAKYAIIGHSERRSYFNESPDMLAEKAYKAKSAGIEPIFCVRGTDDPIPHGVKMIAYEPVAAIGTGQNEPVESIIAMKQKLKLTPDMAFIYGGSVNEKNSNVYLANPDIDGVLVGGASLDPIRFFEIATSCT